jgi:uncharacterized protein YkwD
MRVLAPMIALGACAHAQPGKSAARAAAMVQAHNVVRERFRIPPLIWSDRLAARAQEWADTLLSRHQFVHRPKSAYGENLFEITGATASPNEVVGSWAAEARDYNYRANSCRPGAACGHYTQIVWRNSSSVGCGVARGHGREIWVCNYNPPGNWVGERPY